MLRGYSFRPRGRLLVLAAAGCAAGIALGNWQTRRAEAKLAAAAQLERIAVSGTFIAQRTVYLDNRSRGGKPGYEVVTPLALSPSLAVLVQRGWVEKGGRATVRTPGGRQRIEGIVLARLPRAFDFGADGSGEIRQNLDIAAYAKETGLALQPFAIQQRSDDGDGLSRDWPQADSGVDMNRAYALQWYSLAALCAVLGLVFSFRRVGQG
jgi:cytochrome oxidase assembly protein ShyY1